MSIPAPAGGARGDPCGGRADDIATALRCLLPPCPVSVREQAAGEYQATLPMWAARHLAIGRPSIVTEFKLGRQLGLRAEIAAAQPPAERPGGGWDVTFTVRLLPE